MSVRGQAAVFIECLQQGVRYPVFNLVILIEQVPQLVGLPTDVFPARPGFGISDVLVPSGRTRVLIVAAEHAPTSDHLSGQI